MKKTVTTFIPLIASFALAGIVFYYLIVLPLSGGHRAVVRVSGIEPVYAPGSPVSFYGIISNTGKNSAEFQIVAVLKGADSSAREQKKYFVAGGESRQFSFVLPSSDVSEGVKKLHLSVLRPAKLPGIKDAPLWSSLRELTFRKPLPPPSPVVERAYSAPRPPVSHRAAPPPAKFEEEIIRARFSSSFPSVLSYNESSKISARLTNLSTKREEFEVFLEIISPAGGKTRSKGSVSLAPSETKQVDFLYKVTPEHPEGDYSAKMWHRTRQAVSEDIYEGVFKLEDMPPVVKVKKMLMNPVAGRASEILVEASDDIGVREVIFMAAALKPSGTRTESRNIPMYLAKGDERSGVWRCEYVPEKSDAYFFSFLAVDTKRQRAKLGEFPIKVIK